MEITISISERAEQKIRKQAESNGKDIGEFIGEFVEENFANGKLNGEEKIENIEENKVEEDYENPFTPFLAMFSSGKTDTAERMHEILYSENFDPAEGFSVKK